MNLKQKFYRMCGKSRLYLKRSSPTILCCVAAVGVVGTAVAAVKVTPKAMKLLEDATDEKGTDLSRTEIVLTVAHLYIPAAAIGAGTIFCIFGANALNKQHQTRLMSAYALLRNYHNGNGVIFIRLIQMFRMVKSYFMMSYPGNPLCDTSGK